MTRLERGITRDGKVEGIVNRLDLYAAIVGIE
jgi:hypothetical protein